MRRRQTLEAAIFRAVLVGIGDHGPTAMGILLIGFSAATVAAVAVFVFGLPPLVVSGVVAGPLAIGRRRG